MMRGTTWRAVLVIGVLLIGGALGWRLAARRRSLPCPTWLAWWLENPLAETFVSGRRILDGLDLTPGMRVLDAGCGPGRLTLPAAERVGPTGEVVALDIQSAMLDRLRARAAARGLTTIRPVHAGLGEGALPPATFDRALLVTVLGEIPDRAAALREIFTALKPGGVLAVSEIALDPHFQSPAAVRQLAEAAGFRPGRQFGGPLAYTLHLVKSEPSDGSGPAGRAS